MARGKKLLVVVQIPCLNEAATLPLVLKTIPKNIPGINLLVQIIDDGSTDQTINIARKYGVKHIVKHTRNMGLARSFHDGAMNALRLGADILVNTDADNQYPQERITDLIKPILEGRAEIVIGDRQTATIGHFSPFKKVMQHLGSQLVNKAAGTNLPDAASGFRAYSRQSLLRLNIVTKFSYCMETIIQAGHKRLAITSIKIETNAKTRESRLFKNIWQHMFKSLAAIIRSFIMYQPYVLFLSAAALLATAGLVPFVRYAYLLVTAAKGNHIQSLLLGTVLLTGAFLCVVLGVIADLISINRGLIEDQLELQKRQLFS